MVLGACWQGAWSLWYSRTPGNFRLSSKKYIKLKCILILYFILRLLQIKKKDYIYIETIAKDWILIEIINKPMNKRKKTAIIITAAILLGLVLFVTIAVKFPIVLLALAVTVTVGVGVYGIYKMVYLSIEE
jgi:hypothetical protein